MKPLPRAKPSRLGAAVRLKNLACVNLSRLKIDSSAARCSSDSSRRADYRDILRVLQITCLQSLYKITLSHAIRENALTNLAPDF